MADNFLTRQYVHIPMWGWIIGGVAGLYILTKLKTGSSTATRPTAAVTSTPYGTGQAPSIFFLPQGPYGGTLAPPNINVTVNRNPGNGPTSDVPGTPVSNTPPPPPAPPDPGPPPPAPQDQGPPPPNYVTVGTWGNGQDGLAPWDSTLWGIANHFGTTVDALVNANNIGNPDLIYPGQQIMIP